MARLTRSLLFAGLMAAFAASCGGDDPTSQPADAGRPTVEDPGPVHVHALGANPSDDALFIATHTGLFRLAEGAERATRVADRYQDTMGFTVIGPDRFLGSGHPDGRENLPPFLGLIGSANAGETWNPISLQGKADFHVLETSGDRIWGFGSDFDTRRERLLVSRDGGANWSERRVPEPLISLAIDPDDPSSAIASGTASLHATDDGGRSWRRMDTEPGLLAWPQDDRLFRVATDGSVAVSRDRGRRWEGVRDLPGEPAAFEAAGGDLYAALHDGTIVLSSDDGRSWAVRSRP